MKNNCKKLTSRVISWMLIAVLVLTSFAGCAKTEPVQTSTTQPTQPSTTQSQVASLNDIPLESFSIVYAHESYGYNERAAKYIQSEIESRTGLNLPVLKDSEANTCAYEIVVGNTSRDISSRLEPVSGTTQFAILAEGNQIAMEGEYFVIAAAAYYFIETYVPENNYSAVIPQTVTVHDPIVETPDNFIMLIGDGMGYNQTKLFEAMKNDVLYGHGEDTFFGYYLPYFGYSKTDSLSGTTDSAAGGTALSSGYLTNNKYVGQDKNHQPVQSLSELASTLGKAAAVMSTEVQTGATPSSFSAHADDRNLTDNILASQKETKEQYGIVIDCGYNFYDNGGVKSICNKVTKNLDALNEDPDGFFVMYEEAHIDKHCHNNNLTQTFNAMVRFNRVIAVVMEWAFYHPNTMVLITADHETGGLYPEDGTFKYASDDHSSANVPVFAYGSGAEVFDEATVRNVQIPQTIASMMGVDDFGDQSTYKPLTK